MILQKTLLSTTMAALLPFGVAASATTPGTYAGGSYRAQRRDHLQSLMATAKSDLNEAERRAQVASTPVDLDAINADALTLETLNPIAELVVIDASVPDKHLFISQLKPGQASIEIKTDADGLQQLISALQKQRNLSALHIVSHAESGILHLGNTQIDSQRLGEEIQLFNAMNGSLKVGADVHFYGCDLGAGVRGEEFLDIVQANTHVDIAASNDLTGSTSKGGDWDLEIQRGDVKEDRQFSALALKDFSDVLAIIAGGGGSVNSAGSYNGPASTDASYNYSGRTFTFDGTTVSTAIQAGYVYAGAAFGPTHETSLEISVDSGVFDISSFVFSGDAGVNLTITSDQGDLLNHTTSAFETINLTGFTGISTLTITPGAPGMVSGLNEFAISNIGSANSAPVATAPTAPTVNQNDTNVALADTIQIADGDGDDQTATFTITGGTLTTGTLGLTFGGSGNGSASFTAQGSLANINSALDAATFTPTNGLSGVNAGTIAFVSNDGTANSNAASVTFDINPLDADGGLTAAPGVSEPVGIETTADTVGEAVDVFDFNLSDGGTADGVPLTVSQLVVHVSGTSTDTQRDQITWRLNGNDVSNVTGVYSAGANTVTFSSLSISIPDGTSETYVVNAYYNDNTGITDGSTYNLSVDGDTDLTVGGSGTQMGATSAISNGAGGELEATATALAFTTQPAGSISGAALTTQPVVSARDAFGNVDVDFTETVTLTEASAGALINNSVAASSGVATFSGLSYTATADQQSFTLSANDQDGVGTNLPSVNASAVTSDVVATQLVFSTQPAPLSVSNAVATNFTTVPVVAAQDANGVVDTGYSTGITLAEVNGAGSATMSGTGDTDGSTATVTITPSSGVATFSGLQITYTASGGSSESFNLQASSGGLSTANSSQLTATMLDTDGSLTAAPGVSEPVGIETTADTVGEAVDVFDFNLSDGGTADGVPLTVSQLVVHVSGTSTDTQRDQITWRLNGNDVSNVTGVYSAGANTITFSSLSISVADGTSETYVVNAYYNDNTGITDGSTYNLSVDGDTDLTVGGSGTQMGATSAISNGAGGELEATATALAFTTQPAGSISGAALTTQPVVSARDAFGNVDVDFTETVTLTEASAGALINSSVAASSGVATFSGLSYTATADQQSFTLSANDQDGVGTNLPSVNANAVTSDVVATQLVFSTQPAPLSVSDAVTTNFTTVPVVAAQDANGVVDTGYSTGITLAEVNGAGSATMSGTGDTDGAATTVTLTPSSGLAAFSGLQITYTNSGATNEIFNLSASSGVLPTANSSQLSALVDAAPIVNSVDVPADATYITGESLDFTVNTSEAVTVNTTGGTPQLAITIGTAARQAIFQPGAASSALLFRYTVQAGDLDTDGVAVSALSANGGTLQDAGGNDAVLTLTNVGSTAAVLVDAVASAVQDITISGTPSANATSVEFLVDFDAAVNNVSIDDFVVTTASGTATGTVASVSAVSGDPITVTVNGISGSGSIRLDLDAGTDIQDGSGNGGIAAFIGGSNHTVDRDNPVVSEVTAVTTPGLDTTPDVTFSTNEAGTLSVGGSCGSGAEGAVASGNNTITLTQPDNTTPLANGAFNDCTVTVTDAAGNASNDLLLSSFTVGALQSNTINFSKPADVQFDRGATVTLDVSASSGLAVTFISNTTNVCTVSGNTVSIITAGTCSITASQAGNSTFVAASDVTQAFTITLGVQEVIIVAPTEQFLDVNDNTKRIIAKTALTSGGAIHYGSDSPGTCSVLTTTGVITPMAEGDCILRATAAAVTGEFKEGFATKVIVINKVIDVMQGNNARGSQQSTRMGTRALRYMTSNHIRQRYAQQSGGSNKAGGSAISPNGLGFSFRLGNVGGAYSGAASANVKIFDELVSVASPGVALGNLSNDGNDYEKNGWFISGAYQHASTDENALRRSRQLTFGYDRFFTARWLLGLSMTHEDYDFDFAGDELNKDGKGVGFYSAYKLDEQIYFSGGFEYRRFDNDASAINNVHRGHFNSNRYHGYLQGTLKLPFGESDANSYTSLGFEGSLEDLDRYTTNTRISVPGDKIDTIALNLEQIVSGSQITFGNTGVRPRLALNSSFAHQGSESRNVSESTEVYFGFDVGFDAYHSFGPKDNEKTAYFDVIFGMNDVARDSESWKVGFDINLRF